MSNAIAAPCRTSLLSLVALAFALCLPITSPAGETSCPEHFYGGSAPDLINTKLRAKNDDICYSEFAVKHSGVTRTPIYAAEHLTRQRISSAKEMHRNSKFYAEPKVRAGWRAELSMYKRSGYDRGHMAPSGDFSNAQSQQECFTLANMVPQNPPNNRGIWSDIEGNVRSQVLRRGDLYVVTGPVFAGTDLKQIGGAVMVPSHLFKAVYDPAKHGGVAFLIPNTDTPAPAIISIAELEKDIGINLFPAVPEANKSKVISWPEITSKASHYRRR